ncbi:MAG: helix-turn-helix domain-containing protein [Chitinophagaceae bacterium]
MKCYLDIYMGAAGETVGCLLPAKLEQCIFFSTGPVPLIESLQNKGESIVSTERCCFVRGSVNSAQLQLQIHGVLAMFVVIFHPTGFYRLFGIPAEHFADTFTQGEQSLGKDWEILGVDIRNTTTLDEKVLLAEHHLLKQLKRQFFVPDAVDMVTGKLLKDPEMPVSRMAKESYLSERQFRRKFTEKNGISPQTFSRICRGNKALKMKQLQPQRSWGSILMETGYTDASHFRREMKLLMGIEQPGLQGNDRFVNVQDTHFKLLEKREG